MIHVYIGPTLRPDEPALRGWGMRVLPPARHGDLAGPEIRSGHTVVLIDGLYHQAPALRHKAILAAIARGVRVIGAASIGALRAAELHHHGMIGSGRIYRAYLHGDLTGDDEVAVGQTPDGAALTWPLVNLRHIVRIAEHDGVVSTANARRLLRALEEIPYPQRTEPAVRVVCGQIAGSGFTAWLRVRRTHDPHWGDLKRSDALGALELARETWTPAPRERRPDASTGYTRAWENRLAVAEIDGRPLPTSTRLAYQQLFDPEYARVWSAWLNDLAHRPDYVPVAHRLAHVLDDADEVDPPPAHLVFRPVPDLHDPATVSRLLDGETAADRDAVARYMAANEARREHVRGFTPEAIGDTVALNALTQVWRIDASAVEDQAAARGFRNAADAVEHMKAFLAGLTVDASERTA